MKHDGIKVNLFTAGDSADINTWSNLPYFFSDALLKHGVAVNRVDLLPANDLRYRVPHYLWWKYVGLRHRLGREKPPYDFFRDHVARRLAEARIRQAVRRYDAGFNIFLTYSFSSYRESHAPVIHLCDSTYEHYLEDTGRKPTRRDRREIAREVDFLRHAHLVYCTSRRCCDFIRDHYGIDHARPFDYGINLELDFSEPAEAWLDRKWQARRLLCIGRGIHKRGIDILVEAHRRLNADQPAPLHLDLVGVLPHELKEAGPHVTCHGYLDKQDPIQRERYTQLLRDATLFVMPMREGPPPGVVNEAALAYTPVLISDIWGVGELVSPGQSGLLIDQITPEAFAAAMHGLLTDRERWERLARQAHAHMGDRSWVASVGRLLSEARAMRGEGGGVAPDDRA